MQVADFGLVHDLYVRQVLQGREGEGWWCSCRVAGGNLGLAWSSSYREVDMEQTGAPRYTYLAGTGSPT